MPGRGRGGGESEGLARHLSLVLTTSPSPFHPALDLLETTLGSLDLCPGLSSCNLTVIFDGYRRRQSHRLKSGNVTHALADAYEEYYRRALTWLQKWVHRRSGRDYTWTETHEDLKSGPSTTSPVVMHLLESTAAEHGRHAPLRCIRYHDQIGFALAVRTGLDYVATPCTMVLQHDWAFVKPVPIDSLVCTMMSNPEIKYVTFPSSRCLDYASNKRHKDLPPSTPTLERYPGAPLTPLYFFYDKAHVCDTAHYRTRIFGQGMFRRGDFIEDVYSQHMMAQIKAPSSDEDKVAAWRPFGTFLWYADDGRERVLRHINGRKGYLEEGQRERWLAQGLRKKGLREGEAGKEQQLQEDEEEDEGFHLDFEGPT
ncbi:hypothetical protein HKX48_000845 [Thoreauomyces humboldtii]|nr:hypothetical protein HKX48_000845 [Thoreauomyces humboldtii]